MLRAATDELKSAGVPEAELNAWYLLSKAGSGMDRAFFMLHRDETCDSEVALQLGRLVETRKKGVPLEYITHETEFMGIRLYIDEGVLIPRQDTECLAEEALRYSRGADILDMCTGSGCIAISLALLGDPESVSASDISDRALEIAKKNACDNHADITFIQGDMWENITSGYDLITCNPPYIRSDVIPTLMREVREHEPVTALDGGEDGLEFYRRIMAGVGSFLRENGHLVMETGFDQGEAVAALADKAGFGSVSIIKDLAGLDRVVSAAR